MGLRKHMTTQMTRSVMISTLHTGCSLGITVQSYRYL